MADLASVESAALWLDKTNSTLAFAWAGGTFVLTVPSGPENDLFLTRCPRRLIVFDASELASAIGFSTEASRSLWDVRIAERLFAGIRQDSLNEMVHTWCGQDHGIRARLAAAKATAARPGGGVRLSFERARTLLDLGDALRRQSWTAQLDQLVFVESVASITVREMQRAGVLVDLDGWRELVRLGAVERDGFAAILRDYGIDRPNSEAAITHALARLLGQPVTSSKEGLRRLGDHPVVPVLAAFRRESAFVNDIGTAILQAASASPDGRVRGNWASLGAATGRMTCSAPNLLGIPHAPTTRSKFIAAPGHELISIDASQMELRVAADILQEEKLLKLFEREKTDIHRASAALLLGKDESDVTPEERKRAKVVNFGLLLGMQDAGLQEYARENYGIVLSEAEAWRWRRDFLDQFDRIRSWHERVRRDEETVVVTAAGRRRTFFDRGRDFNARLAHEIQGSAADAMKHALVESAPVLPAYDARLVLAPHDELVFEVPTSAAHEAARAFRAAMEDGFRRVLPRVRLDFDVTIAPHWT